MSPSRVLFALTIGALAGCTLLHVFDGGEPPLAFPHRHHVEEEGMDCTDCHLGADSEDDPGLPAEPLCMLCHEDLDAEKPPEEQVASLFTDGVFHASSVTRLPDEVVFSHLAHVEAVEDCGTCHTGIETSERVGPEVALTMGRCMDCHEGAGVSDDCATCHSEVGRDWQPPSHEHGWEQAHGPVARAQTGRTSDDCFMCHSESTCVKCHQEVPPESHNNFWRLRGHWIQASMDRDNCLACHRTDFCNRCHQDAQPLNHSGMWGNTQNRHCLFCHMPLGAGEQGCAVCHDGTPSHATATPQPSWHTPGANCRQCHGLSAPLPHVDNGDDCSLCHQ